MHLFSSVIGYGFLFFYAIRDGVMFNPAYAVRRESFIFVTSG